MAEALVKEVGIEDLYGFLGIAADASDKEVTSAYRKKALRYHPDKNPDDAVAAEMFQKLSRIYHLLSDPAARAAYDKWLRARDAAQRRHNELSAKRKKLKENLESKESQDLSSRLAEVDAREKMQVEIERLREQSQQMVKEQEELLRQRMACHKEEEEEEMSPTLQVTWLKHATPYSRQLLNDMFSKYGSVEHVAVSRKKARAMVAFCRAEDALQALEEKGLAESPLRVSWFAGQPPLSSTNEVPAGGPEEDQYTEDYEAAVFARMKQAQLEKQQQQEKEPNQ